VISAEGAMDDHVAVEDREAPAGAVARNAMEGPVNQVDGMVETVVNLSHAAQSLHRLKHGEGQWLAVPRDAERDRVSVHPLANATDVPVERPITFSRLFPDWGRKL